MKYPANFLLPVAKNRWRYVAAKKEFSKLRSTRRGYFIFWLLKFETLRSRFHKNEKKYRKCIWIRRKIWKIWMYLGDILTKGLRRCNFNSKLLGISILSLMSHYLRLGFILALLLLYFCVSLSSLSVSIVHFYFGFHTCCFENATLLESRNKNE